MMTEYCELSWVSVTLTESLLVCNVHQLYDSLHRHDCSTLTNLNCDCMHSMQFYATATSSSSVSSSQIQAALKAEYDNGVASVGGSASFAMSNEQKQVSSETSKRTIVIGGLDDGVRAKLIANGDKKPVNADIQTFLEEGKRSSRYGMNGGLMHISCHSSPIYISTFCQFRQPPVHPAYPP